MVILHAPDDVMFLSCRMGFHFCLDTKTKQKGQEKNKLHALRFAGSHFFQACPRIPIASEL